MDLKCHVFHRKVCCCDGYKNTTMQLMYVQVFFFLFLIFLAWLSCRHGNKTNVKRIMIPDGRPAQTSAGLVRVVRCGQIVRSRFFHARARCLYVPHVLSGPRTAQISRALSLRTQPPPPLVFSTAPFLHHNLWQRCPATPIPSGSHPASGNSKPPHPHARRAGSVHTYLLRHVVSV